MIFVDFLLVHYGLRPTIRKDLKEKAGKQKKTRRENNARRSNDGLTNSIRIDLNEVDCRVVPQRSSEYCGQTCSILGGQLVATLGDSIVSQG